MILKKLLESIFQFFQYKVRKTTLCLLFTFMFTFAFKFLKTSLITKELIKREDKFNRKAFHDWENSENSFSEFSYFMKCFKKYMMNISQWFTQWKYREIPISRTALKEIFHSISSPYNNLYIKFKTTHYTILSSFYCQGLVHNSQSSYTNWLLVIKFSFLNGILLTNKGKSVKNI